jgi:hypothetical protein
MTAADFHDAIVLSCIRKAMYLIGSFDNKFRVSKFVDISHVEPPAQVHRKN